MDDLWAGWFLVVLPCAIYLIFARISERRRQRKAVRRAAATAAA